MGYNAFSQSSKFDETKIFQVCRQFYTYYSWEPRAADMHGVCNKRKLTYLYEIILPGPDLFSALKHFFIFLNFTWNSITGRVNIFTIFLLCKNSWIVVVYILGVLLGSRVSGGMNFWHMTEFFYHMSRFIFLQRPRNDGILW